jgi:hypothetical protein
MIDKIIASIVYLGVVASFFTLIWFPSYWVWGQDWLAELQDQGVIKEYEFREFKYATK